MKKFLKSRKFIDFMYINLGILSLSFSFSFFLASNGLVTGGIGGMAINFSNILERIFNVTIVGTNYQSIVESSFILIMNILLLVVAFFAVGKDFCLKTAFCSVMYPIYNLMFSWIYNAIDFGSIFSIYNAAGNPDTGMILMTIVVSSLISGLGIGTAIKHGASTGGVDIIEKIMLVKCRVPFSTTLFVVDGTTVLIAAFLAGEFHPIIYGILYIWICGKMVDSVVFSGFNIYSVSIITGKPDEVKDIIYKSLNRGVTEVNAQGGYTGKDLKLILCVMSNTELSKMRGLIQDVDPQAFLFVNRAAEVNGLGFSKSKYDQ